MKSASFYKHSLQFKKPGGTSRGVLHYKDTYILEISLGSQKGIGECGLFKGLSCDDLPDYEEKMQWLCTNINEDDTLIRTYLNAYPSILFGWEQASRNLVLGNDTYFENQFTNGEKSIKINGLIWMGETSFMIEQIEQKLAENYDCIKLKIGVNWSEEKKVIQELRKNFPKDHLELRVDANGAFSPTKAMHVFEELAKLEIHSIEQPIKAGQVEAMQKLCATTPTPIALDEELIGVLDFKAKETLLGTIKPQYIILKPSLVGGIQGSDEWITVAERSNVGWWITSALESNIGLNAISQYTYSKNPKIPQGLGTGALFTNNFPTHLVLKGDQLWHEKTH